MELSRRVGSCWLRSAASGAFLQGLAAEPYRALPLQFPLWTLVRSVLYSRLEKNYFIELSLQWRTFGVLRDSKRKLYLFSHLIGVFIQPTVRASGRQRATRRRYLFSPSGSSSLAR